MGTGIGRIGPVAHPGGDANRLLLDLDNLGDHKVERCQPFASFPVVGAFALERKRPRLRGRVSDEGLQIRLIKVWTVDVASKRPDVVSEYADRTTRCPARREPQWVLRPIFPRRAAHQSRSAAEILVLLPR